MFCELADHLLVDQGQSEDKSWWPKPNQWNNNHFDQGFWTPWCESWFLNRLNRIRSDQARLYNARQWEWALRQAGDARKFCDALELASNRWLEGKYQVAEADME